MEFSTVTPRSSNRINILTGLMPSIYERKNDGFFQHLYSVSFLVVVIIGAVGTLVALSLFSIGIDVQFLIDSAPQMLVILQFALIISLAALLVGIVQVLFTSWLGEEIVLIAMWVTPFLVMGASLYLFTNTNSVDYLGGLAAGVIFLILVYIFRRSLRLSARLIEVGAEITRDNLVMMRPQLGAYFLKTVVTLLMVPGVVTVFLASATIHPILGGVLAVIYEMMYFLVMSGIQEVANAKNISYVNQWYTSRPSAAKAGEQVSKMKSGILKYAFLMAFVARFKRSSGAGPASLFKFMKFSNWPRLIFGGGSITSTASKAIAYFGSYTLVVMVVKKTNSLGAAYKESASTVFKTFAANIAGSMGFNVIDGLRRLISALLLIGIGVYFAFLTYGNNLVLIVVVAFIFMILGSVPLDSMFQPVVNSYHVLLYRAYTGSASSKMDKRTKDIIKEAKKKK